MRLTDLTCSRLSRSADEYSIVAFCKKLTTIMQNWYDMTCVYKHRPMNILPKTSDPWVIIRELITSDYSRPSID